MPRHDASWRGMALCAQYSVVLLLMTPHAAAWRVIVTRHDAYKAAWRRQYPANLIAWIFGSFQWIFRDVSRVSFGIFPQMDLVYCMTHLLAVCAPIKSRYVRSSTTPMLSSSVFSAAGRFLMVVTPFALACSRRVPPNTNTL